MNSVTKPSPFAFAALAAYERRHDSTDPDHDPTKAQRIYDRYESQILTCIQWIVEDEHEKYMQDTMEWFRRSRRPRLALDEGMTATPATNAAASSDKEDD